MFFGLAGRSGLDEGWPIRSSLSSCGSCRGHLLNRAKFEILKLVLHARTGDKTLRFDYAASQAASHPSEPVGTPHHFIKQSGNLERTGMGGARVETRSKFGCVVQIIRCEKLNS